MRIALIPILIFLFASCSNDQSGQKNLIDLIVKNEPGNPDKKINLDEIKKGEGGLLRNVNLGASPEEVKRIETIGLTEETPDYLFYEFVIDSLNSYTLSYTFESNSLTEIRTDVYVQNDTAAKILSDSFVEYFTEQYKEPVTQNESLWIWSTLYNKEPIRIEFTDESAEYDHVGKLSLIIYKEPVMAM